MKFFVVIAMLFLGFFTYDRTFNISFTRWVDYVTSGIVILALFSFIFSIYWRNNCVRFIAMVSLVLSFSYYVVVGWINPLGGVIYSLLNTVFLLIAFILPLSLLVVLNKKFNK